jgi:hypothetical protein
MIIYFMFKKKVHDDNSWSYVRVISVMRIRGVEDFVAGSASARWLLPALVLVGWMFGVQL